MSNQTVERPLSFWSYNHPTQFKQKESSYWPIMKGRAQMAGMKAGSGYKKCSTANCCKTNQSCSCNCHNGQNVSSADLPVYMAGINQAGEQTNGTTHPAVAVRKYILQDIDRQHCHIDRQTLPWIEHGVICPVVGEQTWFSKRTNSSMALKEKIRTSANERAKTGFQYWFKDRPKPTNHGRYSIGTKYTQMGLSFAPRS